jgi:hypothetical protein
LSGPRISRVQSQCFLKLLRRFLVPLGPLQSDSEVDSGRRTVRLERHRSGQRLDPLRRHTLLRVGYSQQLIDLRALGVAPGCFLQEAKGVVELAVLETLAGGDERRGDVVWIVGSHLPSP